MDRSNAMMTSLFSVSTDMSLSNEIVRQQLDYTSLYPAKILCDPVQLLRLRVRESTNYFAADAGLQE